jgi:CAAX protease family protein
MTGREIGDRLSFSANGLGAGVNIKKEVLLFLSLTLGFSGAFYVYLFASQQPRWGEAHSAAFMWCPGLAAIATKLILRRPLAELGLRWGNTTRYLFGVIFFPYLLAAAVYLTVWIFGLGAFNSDRLSTFLARVGLGGFNPKVVLPFMLLVIAPLGAVTSAVSALGEELGWRGLLARRLSGATSFARASVLVGLIWSVWHYPLMFALLPSMRPKLPLWYATACFTLSVVGVSFFYTWLRQRSGSVWPAVFLHAASNGAQTTFEVLTIDTGVTHYLTYEYGIGFVIVIWLAVGVFLIGRRARSATKAAEA